MCAVSKPVVKNPLRDLGVACMIPVEWIRRNRVLECYRFSLLKISSSVVDYCEHGSENSGFIKQAHF
jgi:hypothetical protein